MTLSALRSRGASLNSAFAEGTHIRTTLCSSIRATHLVGKTAHCRQLTTAGIWKKAMTVWVYSGPGTDPFFASQARRAVRRNSDSSLVTVQKFTDDSIVRSFCRTKDVVVLPGGDYVGYAKSPIIKIAHYLVKHGRVLAICAPAYLFTSYGPHTEKRGLEFFGVNGVTPIVSSGPIEPLSTPVKGSNLLDRVQMKTVQFANHSINSLYLLGPWFPSPTSTLPEGFFDRSFTVLAKYGTPIQRMASYNETSFMYIDKQPGAVIEWNNPKNNAAKVIFSGCHHEVSLEGIVSYLQKQGRPEKQIKEIAQGLSSSYSFAKNNRLFRVMLDRLGVPLRYSVSISRQST